MAILIKNYKWKQTESNILIQLPLNGIHQSKVDIFTSEKFIKASYKPYIFEAFLLDSINVEESTCTLTNSEITFTLKKCKNVTWQCLEEDISRSEKLVHKNKAIEDSVRKGVEERKQLANKKAELKRVAVRAAIELDTKHRNDIESIKEFEKSSALNDLQLDEQTESFKYNLKLTELSEDEEQEIQPEKLSTNKIKRVQLRKKPTQTVPVPLPRKTVNVSVNFTPREFPTPSRESQAEEEERWLRKQLDARRSCGFVSEDLRPEEKNPQWLKDKGDEFLRAKNYLGAISAYSFGIKLSDKFVNFYVKRAEAHFTIGNLHKCINDCSKALELMVPTVQSNLVDRAGCLALRGKALHKLGIQKEAINELEAALKLLPSDEQIKHDFDIVQRAPVSTDDANL